MAAANSTSYDALLRELWPQSDIFDLLYENNTFFAQVPKDTSFYEKTRHIALGYGTTQGVGADFASAKSSKAASQQTEFKITPVSYYSLFSISRQLLRRAGNKKAAILPALERETKMAMQAWKRDTAILLWGSGIGNIGTSTALSGATLTFSTDDVKHFEKNMQIELAATPAATTSTPRAGYITVSAVNRTTGVVTFTGNITAGIPAAVSGDIAYRRGNCNAVVTGVQGWIPASDPTSTSFFGCDRSVDTLRMGGIRTTATGLSPRAAAMKAAKEVFENGGNPTHYYLNPADYLNLQMELSSAGNLQVIKEPGAPIGKYVVGIPFEGISFMGPTGQIKVFPDINAPVSYGHMLQLDTWTLGTMGDAPYFDMEDGNRILRETDADAFEGRIVGDFQLWCEAPGKNARVAL